jgi:hypothetical protein
VKRYDFIKRRIREDLRVTGGRDRCDLRYLFERRVFRLIVDLGERRGGLTVELEIEN